MNPYAAPSLDRAASPASAPVDVDLGPVVERYKVHDKAGTPMEYVFHANHLVVLHPNGTHSVHPRADFGPTRPLVVGRASAILVLDLAPPYPRLTFAGLSLDALRRFLEPEIDRFRALCVRQRVRSSLAAAIITLVVALLVGFAERRHEVGVAVAMLALWLLSRVSSRRILFLFEALLWVAMAAATAWTTYLLRNWFSWVISLMFLSFAWSPLRHHHFFGPPAPLPR